MGVGKTTIGRQLSKKMQLEFVDLDKVIESKFHKKINELFQEIGEEAFRKIEHQCLEEISDFENVVVSTGGGTPCFFDNMEIMNAKGTTVYIHAQPEELAARLQASKTVRPIISQQSPENLVAFIEKHLEQRAPFYEKAKKTYRTDKLITRQQIQETVDGIYEQLKNEAL